MYKGINVVFVNLKTLMGGREGMVIHAEIKYNGRKIATYRDDGNGGEVDITPIGGLTKDEDGGFHKSQQLIDNFAFIKQMNEEFNKLPKCKSEYGDFHERVEFAMDELINNRELLKDAKKGVLVKDSEDSRECSVIKFKVGSIPAMLKRFPRSLVVELLEKEMKREMADGNYIPAQDYYITVGVDPAIFKK